MNRSWRRFRWEGVLGAAVALLLGSAWLWIRWVYLGGAEAVSLKVGAFLGWVGLALLVATVSGVVWAASIQPKSAFDGVGMRVLLGFAIVGDVAGVMVAAVGLGEGLLEWEQIGKLYAVLVAWTALWTAAAWALRRWGPGVAIGLSLLLASLLFAGPVAGMPLVRGIGRWEAGGADHPWQARVVAGIGAACPMMAGLDGVRPRIAINWATLPGMYAMSGLGQDVPMELPRWWVSVLAYGVGAGVLALAGRPRAPALTQ